MNNETDIGIKFTASVNGNKKLNELATSLATIKAVSDGINTGVINSLQIGADTTKEIAKNTSTMANVTKLAFNFSTTRMFARTLGHVAKELTRLANKSSEYLENVNLFQVAFNDSYDSAERFVNKISEMYGLDESRITRVVGIFKQLANAMNVSAETGEKLATLMTQMSLDISSLYNVDFERATSVLQSAFSGQTKPIRGTTGADITQTTLQTTLDSLGIDRAVNQLTFAEKRLLIIISLTQQLRQATNDLGRTIESPANQLKVLSEQWQRLSRALGNTFLPILAKILPYLNAILMVLTEIINMIANVIKKLFGFKDSDFDYFSGTTDAVMDLEDSMGKATASAGKLKKALSGLRGFDKLNVISTPSSGGGSGGGTGGTGIDTDILKAFNDAYDSYNSKLSDIKMKASSIRDSIMEWLGFTKEIDPATGKIVWKYQGFSTTLKNMWKWFKDLSLPMKTVVGYIAFLIGKKVYNGFKAVFDLIKNSKLLTKIRNLFSPLEYLGMLIKDNLTAKTMTFGEAIGKSMDQWSQSLTKVDKFKVALIGSAGLLGAFKLIDSSMKDIATQGELTSASVIKSLGGISLNALSLATMLGSQFGKEGFVIGAIAGGVLGIIEIIDGALNLTNKKIEDEINENNKKIKELNEDIANSQKNLDDAYKNSKAHSEYYQSLLTELNSIVDENGYVKKGYEDRAEVITTTLAKALGLEIELSENQIQNWQTIREEINKLIKKKEALAKLEALEAEYQNAIVKRAEAVENEASAYDTLKEATSAVKDKFDEVAKGNQRANEALQGFKDAGMTTAEMVKYMNENYDKLNSNQRFLYNKTRDEIEQMNKATNSYEDASKQLEYYNGVIYDYEKASEYAITENTDALNKYFDHERFLRGKSLSEKQTYWESEIDKNKRYLENLERNKDNYDKNYYESQKKAYQDQLALADSELKRLEYLTTTRVEDISDDMINYFYQTGSKSKEQFMSEMEQLPPEVQKEVVDQMYAKGYAISDELQAGIDALDLKKDLKLGVDDKDVKTKFNKLFGENGSIGKILAKVGIKIPTIQLASGGLPQVGQLFVANEKGPELVGQIGGQSFVANQNQVVDLIDRKLSNVNTNKDTQVYNIYLDEYHKIGTYTLEQLENMAKTNGKPINIG